MNFSKSALEILNEMVLETLHSRILPGHLSIDDLIMLLNHVKQLSNVTIEDHPEEEVLRAIKYEAIHYLDANTFQKLVQDASSKIIDCANTDAEKATSIHVGEVIQSHIETALINHSPSAFVIVSPIVLIMLQCMPASKLKQFSETRTQSSFRHVGTFDNVPVYCYIYASDDSPVVVANNYDELESNRKISAFEFQNMSFI